MSTPLDNILSGQGDAAPAPEEKVTPQVEAGTESSEAVAGTESEPTGGKTVPLEALHAERQKTKRYTEQVADFERTLRERDAAWERRHNELVQRLAPQQQQERPDFFTDPDAAVQAAIQAATQPVVQHISQMSEAVSRRFAMQEHGAESVNAAYGELEKRMASDPASRVDYVRIMQSGDPWGELVRWHKRETTLAEFGSDPVAYRDKLKAELLAELKGEQPSAQPNGRPNLPSNLASARNVGTRSGPAWSGPTPLDTIFKMK